MRQVVEDFKWVNIIVNSKKDIVIFPVSKSEKPIILADGSEMDDCYLTAYAPIELRNPYDKFELAEKIKQGIAQWNKYPCYKNFSGKNTFEEKYYGIKGFKNATKGCLLIRAGWDDIQGKYVSLSMPCKRGYQYMGLKTITLPDTASWIDFASTVIQFINTDVTMLTSYKTYKRILNV